MKNKTRKIIDFLFQDVHFKHNYFLIGGILLFLTIVGATSYALFSYEVYSPNSIHITYYDEGPVCIINSPEKSALQIYETTTFIMNCTDNISVKDVTLTSNDFNITGGITINDISKETIEKGYKYIISVTANTTSGTASIQLKNNIFQDDFGLYNKESNISNSILIVEPILCDAMEEEISGANSPKVSLASNMIPVCYNSNANSWVKADASNLSKDNQWYSYSGKTWANAVTVTEKNRQNYLDAPVGTKISMNDINTMWVWIPRFSASKNGEYNGATQFACSSGDYEKNDCINFGNVWNVLNPGAFNITFVDVATAAHDAFTFGSQNLSGMWIGKFENSSDTTCSASENSTVGFGCNLNTIRPKIIPNVTSWRGAMVSTIFYDILNMTESGNQYGFDKTVDTNLDTHMLKNNEWGAVAYLTQSIYGRCTSSTSCSEIGINNDSGFRTGYGAPAGSGPGTYETTLGMDASTTGNIYGVYDMSGGARESVMGVFKSGTYLWSGLDSSHNSGFNGCLGSTCEIKSDGISFPEEQYYNAYNISDTKNVDLQHTLYETFGWYSDTAYNDGTYSFVKPAAPWLTRGGKYNDTSKAGIFTSNASIGNGFREVGSRTAIVK